MSDTIKIMPSAQTRTFVAAALTACALHACSPADVSSTAVSIENITVIDAAKGAQPNMDVLYDGAKIIAVTAHSAGANGAGTTIDGTGKYLIPGLWDAHVHLAYTPGLDHTTFFPLSLAHGITSLRDTGGQLELLADARALAKSDPLTPNLFVAGPLVDGPLRVYDGRSASFPNLSVGASTPAEGRAIVDGLAAANVDLIKAYEMLPEDVFKAVVDQADSHGLPVAAHIPLSMTAEEAVAAGAADFQHLRNLEFSCAGIADDLHDERLVMLEENNAPHAGALRSKIHSAQRAKAIYAQDSAACNALITTLAANEVFQTPTLSVTRFFGHQLYAQPRWQETYKLIPPTIGAGWLERSLKLSNRAADADTLAYDAWVQTMVKRLSDAGVRIMAGTDAPIAFLTPGASLHEELAMLVEAGLTPLQALDAATLAPAQFFGLEDQMGLIAPGMQADIVILSANPLDDIRNTLSISAVIKSGEMIDRAALDTFLAMPSKITLQ